jgi:hypothetical protein
MDPTPPDDPVTLVRRLDPAALRRRLTDLDNERAALLVLLRAALHAKPDAPLYAPSGQEAAGA